MAQLPRGIAEVRHTNKDGSETVMYRVRINTKKFKADKRFNDIEEAKEFLALSKLKKGKEIIYKITEEERLRSKTIENDIDDYSLGYFIDRYINDYVLTRQKTNELEKRNIGNILSFYKTIKNTSIIDRTLTSEEKEEMGIDTSMPVSRFFHAFDIRKIKAIEINLYIKERLKSVKPASISRELSHISNVYSKLQYFNESLADLPNPIRNFDKDLLKNRTAKREINITKEDEELFFKLLSEKDNKQMFKIATISILTSLRRSEIIYLKKSQVKENYIDLIFTKSGRPRKVYIDKQAKDYLNSLTVFPNDRFFTYTISGFDRVFRAFTKKHGFAEKIHFHDLRRLAISKKIIQIGASNSVFLTEFLGIQSISKFENNHLNSQVQEPVNQEKALYSFGHSFPQTTKIYFNMPKIILKETKK